MLAFEVVFVAKCLMLVNGVLPMLRERQVFLQNVNFVKLRADQFINASSW